MDKVTSPAFRTATVGGFNKSDVNEYIAKLGRDFDEKKTELEKEIEALKSSLEESKSKSEAVTDKAPSEDNDAIKEELERANALIEEQTKQLEEAKLEAEILKGDLEEANSKLERFTSFEEKAAQYETMTARMGEIYIEATADAERIRNESKQKSEALISDTEAKCREKMELTEKMLDEFAVERKAEISALFEDTHSKINELLKAFYDKSTALASDATKLRTDAPPSDDKNNA
ncbi:MAG: hypothetical protein IJY93_05330 [Clostridia bacterium]|nr:hypothetical protein [Clostridia bacterium]